MRGNSETKKAGEEAMIFLFRLILGLLVVVIVTTICGLGYRTYLQTETQSNTKITTPNGIESLEIASLNGSKQWIYLRGHDQNNPVLLFLHGGPGAPEMAIARRFGLELEKHFTVVHWDQRASGKSRREPFSEGDLSMQTYLDDTLALVMLLRKRFNQDKIYLLGHSWGTILGTLTAREHPAFFHAYIGMGQLVNLAENEHLSLEYVIKRAREENNAEALAELLPLTPPYTEDPSELSVLRKWLYHYDGGLRGVTVVELFGLMLRSPEYSILDTLALALGFDAVSSQMWPEMGKIDFTVQATKLEVPVYFFTGRYDYNTPFVLTERYFDLLDAPQKEIIWFEESAHFMNVSDPDRFQHMLINKVLPETFPTVARQ